MANKSYNYADLDIVNGGVRLTLDTLKVMLVASGYVFNKDHEFVASPGPAAGEVTGTNYTPGFGGAGRKTLANPVAVVDLVNDRAELSFDDPVWTALGADVGQVAAAVVIEERTSDADSRPVFYIDSGFPFTPNGGDLTLNIDPEGLYQLTS